MLLVVPDMTAPPAGCRLAPRCPFADDTCRSVPPPIVRLAEARWSRCHKALPEGHVPAI